MHGADPLTFEKISSRTRPHHTTRACNPQAEKGREVAILQGPKERANQRSFGIILGLAFFSLELAQGRDGQGYCVSARVHIPGEGRSAVEKTIRPHHRRRTGSRGAMGGCLEVLNFIAARTAGGRCRINHESASPDPMGFNI